MTGAATVVQKLFGPPGGSGTDPVHLLKQAASAHAALLSRAAEQGGRCRDPSLAPVILFLRGHASAGEKRRLLCHPLFVEGLHGLAPFYPELGRWHECVASTTSPVQSDPIFPGARANLGNVALVLLLRADRQWHGDLDLCADAFGRVSFPFCDWSLTLYSDQHTFMAGEAVNLSIEHDHAFWRLGGRSGAPFLTMHRDDCLKMLLDNDEQLDIRRLKFPDPHVRPRLQFANRLERSNMRYEPIGFENFEEHAGLTGAIVEHLTAAIRRNSPAVFHELCAFVHTVRGFELPRSPHGVIESFSDPTTPGVMNINIPYTCKHEPCLSPFCFTWFGHELGHTKDYLIDNVLYCEGETLVRNAGESTAPIPRYGRPLSVRTLFQVPYVHLYEWTLLMDFLERGFRGLPWRVTGGAVAFGEDLAAEIEEAFELISNGARLTPLGEVAVRHFGKLFALARARWHSLPS